VSEECSAWLKEDGFGHISPAAAPTRLHRRAEGARDLRPARGALDGHYISDRFRTGLRIQELYPDWLVRHPPGRAS
jgi:hypothetical protein